VFRALCATHALLAFTTPARADLAAAVDRLAEAGRERVVAWRRHIHAHPELSNREHRTAELVARELSRLGLEVRTGIAHTGVVAVLRGGRTGGVVALRADMDALPVAEETGLPFASTVRGEFMGREVPVMHACGHDAHTAILLGAAEVLSSLRDELPGTVVFLFQPAEERPPPGEEGGARLMLEEGALDDPAPGAIFALHADPDLEAGALGYRPGGAMASSDAMRIVVTGRQTHAAYPWRGVDAIAVASRIALALPAIPGRQVDARIPAVVSIGAIHGGLRHNIIPEQVELLGTIRSLDPEQRLELHRAVRRTALGIAASAGAEVAVEIDDERGYPVTVNDPSLGRRMRPTLEEVAGEGRVREAPPRTGSEDFAFYAERIPGFYFRLGVRPPDVAPEAAAALHSPRFSLDESALPLGVRAMSRLALDYLTEPAR
jgi:amidohydrolase